MSSKGKAPGEAAQWIKALIASRQATRQAAYDCHKRKVCHHCGDKPTYVVEPRRKGEKFDPDLPVERYLCLECVEPYVYSSFVTIHKYGRP